jgi:hypothetical protein
MDTSDLTKKPTTVSNHEKRGNPTIKRRKVDYKTELRSGTNNIVSHMYVQGPSTATCMELTTYHNIPTDSSIPGKGCRLMWNINHHTEILSQDQQ